jgi:hypothetical protein
LANSLSFPARPDQKRHMTLLKKNPKNSRSWWLT